MLKGLWKNRTQTHGDSSAVEAFEEKQTASDAVSKSIRRILVVDDSRMQRTILARMLSNWGFDVVGADSGEAAMALLDRFDADLILSDWMMPGMSGLDLCRIFRSRQTGRYRYFILLTSKNTKGEIAQGLDAGADDFVPKPVDSSELRARIAAGDRILSMQDELSRKNTVINRTLDKLRDAYDVIDKDLKQARKIQESLVPERSRTFSRSEVSLLLKPCGHIGGDLVGMFSPVPDKLAFYCIDVSGHGITSAMMTARLSGYLSSTHFDQNIGTEIRFDRFFALLQPAEVARRMNLRLTADQGIDEYFTMAYATVDLKTGYTRLVQAGHPHPALLRKDGTVSYIGEGGLPIGLVPEAQFTQTDLWLEDGDRLLLYSDGITECQTKSGDMLEEKGMTRLLNALPSGSRGADLLDDLFWSLSQEMCPTCGFQDDISGALLEFKRTKSRGWY